MQIIGIFIYFYFILNSTLTLDILTSALKQHLQGTDWRPPQGRNTQSRGRNTQRQSTNIQRRSTNMTPRVSSLCPALLYLCSASACLCPTSAYSCPGSACSCPEVASLGEFFQSCCTYRNVEIYFGNNLILLKYNTFKTPEINSKVKKLKIY